MNPMELQKFALEVSEKVAEKLGEGYEVEIKPVLKNNSVVLTALMIKDFENSTAPTIYLDSFYSSFVSGKRDINDIVEEICDTYLDASKDCRRLSQQVKASFGNAASNIIFKIVNADMNEEMLSTMPHFKFCDFAVTFHYVVDSFSDGELGTIRITDSLMQLHELDPERLLEIALQNTPKLFPYSLRSMTDVISEMTGCSDIAENPLGMYVLTNTRGLSGASTMLYAGVLDDLLLKFGDGYVLPSSTHEVIFVASASMASDNLDSMICEINDTQVANDEVLGKRAIKLSELRDEVNGLLKEVQYV